MQDCMPRCAIGLVQKECIEQYIVYFGIISCFIYNECYICVLISVNVAATLADVCYYRSKESPELKSYKCEEGCCGDEYEQECCKTM